MSRLSLRVVEQRHRAVHTSRLTLAGRPRLLLDYECAWGTFQGEAAPLTGYGDDSLEHARQALEAWTAEELDEHADRLFQTSVSRGEPVLASAWEGVHAASRHRATSPSARFAVDQLLTRVLAHRAGLPSFRVLAPRPVASSLAVSQVLSPSNPGELSRAADHLREGVRTFKLKCGVHLEDELRFAHELRQLGEPLRLRVDANGSFTPADVRLWAEKHGGVLDWVEDPTLDPDSWPSWSQPGWALAVDEPLVGRSPLGPGEKKAGGFGMMSSSEGAGARAVELKALVLKPMALGGWAPCLRWAEAASKRGVQICISHLFDGPQAAWACATLAFAIQSPETAVGLSRHAGLQGAEAELPWLTGNALRLESLDDRLGA